MSKKVELKKIKKSLNTKYDEGIHVVYEEVVSEQIEIKIRSVLLILIGKNEK